MMIPDHFQKASVAMLVSILTLMPMLTTAQKNSVVQVHADKSSGYGVAYGGPNATPDLIVTALHVVSGKKSIMVVWQGKTAYAQIEKIYKPADLALLKLQSPLGVPPLQLYSGEPPWDSNINFWEVPVNTKTVSAKTTILEERTSLAKISPRIANNPAGLSKSLCMDAGSYYPAINTEVINFKEPNIRKAHSGSPLTYGDKILGMVDGGAKLTDGKACVWAIPASDFTKLFNQGTAVTKPMQSCDTPTASNKFMYSGMRSDNPMLSPEEIAQAEDFENTLDFSSSNGNQLALYHEYRMGFDEIYETLWEEEQANLGDIIDSDETITLDDLLNETIDIFIEEYTGISLVVPAACTLTASTDDYGTMITTTSPGGLITMSFYISTNATMEEGMTVMSEFKSYLQGQGVTSQPDADDIDDFAEDEDNPYYSQYIEQAFEDDNGIVVAEFFADLMVNDGDFLAVTVSINDWNLLDENPEERLFLYLMETCSLLSDFSIY